MVLSIVVPVYNVEKYIEECVFSLLDADEKSNYEIILIDDGSTDSSGIICDRLSSVADNIKVFHKSNGGLSDARNYGIRKATGDYIYFIDSDDYLANGAIKKIIDMTYDIVDVGVFDASVVDEMGNSISHVEYSYSHPGLQNKTHYSPKVYIEKQLDEYGDFVTTVWLGVYRREFLLQNLLWFEPGLLHEDELWSQIVLIKASDIIYFKECLYRYRKRENSIMSQKNNHSRNMADIIYIYEKLLLTFDHDVDDNELRKKIKGNIVKRYLHAIAKYGINNKELNKRISKNELLMNAIGPKDRIRTLVLCFSISLYCCISKWLMKG